MRLERSEVGVQEHNPATRTTLTEQHRGSDLTTAQGHPHAAQTEAEPSENMP